MLEEQLNKIKVYIKEIFKDDVTGHDFHHMIRVSNIAKEIAIKENADLFICEAGGLLHDIGDIKLFSDRDLALESMKGYLKTINLSKVEIESILIAVEDISFSGGETPATLEGRIIQDADRLDAIGAIGIGRTFAYGGAKGKLLYNSDGCTDTTIQHFHDKLLRIKSLLNTKRGKELAMERHMFTEKYIEQFIKEWNEFSR